MPPGDARGERTEALPLVSPAPPPPWPPTAGQATGAIPLPGRPPSTPARSGNGSGSAATTTEPHPGGAEDSGKTQPPISDGEPADKADGHADQLTTVDLAGRVTAARPRTEESGERHEPGADTTAILELPPADPSGQRDPAT